MCPICLYSKDWKRKRKFRQEKKIPPVIFWVIKQEKKRKERKGKERINNFKNILDTGEGREGGGGVLC